MRVNKNKIMNKQTTNAIKSLVLAAILSVVPACQTASVNTNGANTNAVESSSNINKDAVPPVAENNSNTDAPVSEDNADSKSSDNGKGEKLAQRIVGMWEGKNPEGEKIALDFRDDNMVYPVSDGKTEKPAKYKVIDEENVELTTPDEKPEIFKIKVKGNKMTVTADTMTIELTKAN